MRSTSEVLEENKGTRPPIEIDGASHLEAAQAEYDGARTAWLEESGYRRIAVHSRLVEGGDAAGVG